MSFTNYAGIDYGAGTTNRDRETGIRYGVISIHALNEWALESFEADYGPPTCGTCGNELVEYDDEKHSDVQRYDDNDNPEDDGESLYVHGPGCADYACETCRTVCDSSEAYGDEPIGWDCTDPDYVASLDSYNDVFLTRSPYFTYAQFCSPCAPGAGHLENPTDRGGAKTYCFGHDWFPNNKAPYRVYEVATGRRIRGVKGRRNGSRRRK